MENQDTTTQAPSAEQKTPSIDKDEVIAATKKYLADENWAKIFFNAPSEAAQNRIALNFWVSENISKPDFPRDVYLALRERLEQGMKREDLEYMIHTTENEAAKQHFRRLLLDLPDENADAPQDGQQTQDGAQAQKEGGDGTL